MKKVIAILIITLMLFSITACQVSTSGTQTTPKSDSTSTTTTETKDQKTTEQESTAPKTAPIDLKGRPFRIVAKWNEQPTPGASKYGDFMLSRQEYCEKTYNVKFEYVVIPNAEYNEKFMTTTMAGDPAGELWFNPTPDVMPSLMAKNYLLPLSDYINFEHPKWNKSVIQTSTYKGKIYACSNTYGQAQNGLFFNKKIFAEEGFENPYDLYKNNQWTWDKMLEIAKAAIKDFDGDGKVDRWGISRVNEQDLIFSNGGKIIGVDDQGDFYVALNDQKVFDALQFFYDLHHVYKVAEIHPEDAGWDYGMNQFAAGKAAMYYGPYSEGGGFSEAIGPEDWGYVYFPKGPGATDYCTHFITMACRVVPATVKDPEIICRIIDDFLVELPLDVHLSQKQSGAPDPEVVEITLDMVKNRSVYNPLRTITEAYDAFNAAVDAIMNGSKTPKAAMEEIIGPIEEAIKKRAQELALD